MLDQDMCSTMINYTGQSDSAKESCQSQMFLLSLTFVGVEEVAMKWNFLFLLLDGLKTSQLPKRPTDRVTKKQTNQQKTKRKKCKSCILEKKDGRKQTCKNQTFGK